MHANSLGAVADAVFPEMGNYRFPHRIPPPMAREWFENLYSICARRAGNNHWPLSPPGMDMDGISPTLPALWVAVERHLDRAPRRFRCAWATPFSHTDGPIALGAGEIVQAPSDDGPVPAARDLALTLPPAFGIIRSVQDSPYIAPMDVTAPNAQTPERKGGPLDAPITEEARTSRDTEDVNLREYGLPSRDTNFLPLGGAQDDRAHAISCPLLGWPDFLGTFGDSGGGHVTHSIFDMPPYRKMASKSSCTREAELDPVSIVPAEAGAVRVNQ